VSGPGDPRLKFSVVIPSWHDAENLRTLLPALRKIDMSPELIIVDASSDNESEEIATAFGAAFIRCSAPNRGAQMNVGGMFAHGDVLVFQHADTELTGAHLAAIETALSDREIIGGAFFRKFDGRHPRLMWLERVARFLTQRGGTLFGDQTVFVRREVFLRLHGFAQMPLMEDVEFSRRLRGAGKVAILDPPVRSSARRHLRRGAWRTSIQNGILLFLYRAGVSPHRLHRWYYRGKRNVDPARMAAPLNSAEQS
jgi:uncharacterized protein